MMNRPVLLNVQIARILFVTSFVLAAICIVLNAVDIVTLAYTPLGGYIAIFTLAVLLPTTIFLATRYKMAVPALFAVLNIACAFVFLLYIGAYNPFVLAWAIVIALTYVHYGVIGFTLSSLSLAVITAICIWIYKDILGPEQVVVFGLLSIIVSAATVLIAYIAVRLLRNSKERATRLEESKKSEALQLNRLNTLLNSISDTVLTLNRYSRITSQNAAALSFFDTNQSLVNKSIDSILVMKDMGEKPVSINALMQDLRTTVIRDDVSIVDSNDGIMRLSIQLSPIHGTYQEGATEDGAVLIIRDITRQKALEDEKDEFISVTSHELRTPIAIAEGSLSNLMYMFEKNAKPEALASSANMAHEQVLYLARMINDLSTLSRAERGVGDVAEEIDVNELLHELYLRYQPEAEAKELKLDLDLDHLPKVTTSRLYLEEMLQNFLTNAIKYTNEGTVTLIGKVVDGRIECAVKDSGIGISKADQDKIFEKFFRSEDYRTRETSGTGLGLYVVHKLANKLDTKIEVKSRLNHGSTFSFKLPQQSSKLGTGKRTSV
ncbi:MAG: hypothetical protein EOO17_01515 [Chloroflexi bacterium]|nr:MAG: hypothetical protein EOO17_01515 [Chloroflexota bacterium]